MLRINNHTKLLRSKLWNTGHMLSCQLHNSHRKFIQSNFQFCIPASPFCNANNKYPILHGRSVLHRCTRQYSQPETEEDTLSKGYKRLPERRVSFYQKLKNAGIMFWTGGAGLMKDTTTMVKTTRKLGLYKRRDLSMLTRKEARHLRQTRKDLVKTMPLTILFAIPFLGYVVPFLAYLFPKKLLSSHFWDPEQKQEFLLEEFEKRSQYYCPLVKEVGTNCLQIKNEPLLKLCIKVLDGNHPSNLELLQHVDEFSRDNEMSLKSMPRYHLVDLCRCFLIPTRWYIPRFWLTRELSKRMKNLHEDDLMIARDGIDSLTQDDITDAVHFRGVDINILSADSEKRWLKEWVDLSVQVADKDVSFLSHCAVFKAANTERIEQKLLALITTEVKHEL